MKKRKLLFAPWSGNNKNYAAYQAWYSPLKNIFEEIIIFDPQENIYHYGQYEMNKKFLELIEKEKPDYIFFLLIYDEFYIDTLLKIREISPLTRTINFFGDDDSLYDNFSRFYSLIIDYHLVSQVENIVRYRKDKIERVFPSFAVNTERFYQMNLEKVYDVTFIGSPKEDRYKIIKFLKDSGINIKIFGTGWSKYADLNEIYGGVLDYESLVKVINQSKININFTKNRLGIPHFKSRLFEIASCKSFMISEYYSGYMRMLKKDIELVMFKDEYDLLDKIKYYLKNENEREKIAELAYKKVIKYYTQDYEFNKIFRKIFSDENKKIDREFPNIKEKIIETNKQDLYRNEEELAYILKDADYVSFRENSSIISTRRNYFQMYSLKKSGKDISCCDYNIYSKNLGIYLGVSAEMSFNKLKPKDFSKVSSISQFVIKKNYLLKNLNNFKEFLNHRNENFITRENTCFVSIPLISIKKELKLNYDKIDKFCFFRFENNFRVYKYQKRLFSSLYIYKLLLKSILKEKFILKHLIKKANL